MDHEWVRLEIKSATSCDLCGSQAKKHNSCDTRNIKQQVKYLPPATGNGTWPTTDAMKNSSGQGRDERDMENT